MDFNYVFSAILTLVAGIGIFLIACNMMSKNLEALGSTQLKKLFASVSGSDIMGVGIGAVGTAAIQSSGATTVMVIGFVNAGIMSLHQAATVIYGANIGTTITGQIVALGLSGKDSVSTTVIFSALAGVGAFMMSFAKSSSKQTIGGIIAGFGMLFVGLSMMSNSMESFAYLDSVRNFLASIDNILLLVLVGTVLTAIVQSSSVMTSVAITMVVAGLISLTQGIYLTMGSNIGSCVVAIMAAASSGKNAKRTALIHLLFNVFGVVLFLAIGQIIGIASKGEISFGSIFHDLFPKAPQLQLAMFHSCFNIICSFAMLPLTDRLVRLVTKLIPEQEEVDPNAPKLYYVNDHLLNTPVIALQQLKNEIFNMSKIAMHNYHLALEMFESQNLKDEELFRWNEKELNFLNKELQEYLAKLSGAVINDDDAQFMARSFHVINDLERIGDYSVNIVQYTLEMIDAGGRISEAAHQEIEELRKAIDELYERALWTYTESDMRTLGESKVLEDRVDAITEDMSQKHIERAKSGKCEISIGAYYLSLISDSERVADHIYNMAKSIA
ncbi:MAG: Na/Pi cotransporter family protein [Mogibacterium sp.]|nr:Na/Pi cotransporter family protein [Mogibacterium sp.]